MMLRYISHYFMLAVATFATHVCLAQSNASSEDEAYKDWYQVEVIAFERTDAASYEVWSHHPHLVYPLKLERIVTGSEAQDAAFVRLPKDARALNNHAGTLRNRRGYRVLLHEAWRQPITDSSQAPSVLIVGGDQFGEHYELEGSIKLSLSRYLHIDTNLWLTKFDINYNQSQNGNTQKGVKTKRVSLPTIPSPSNRELDDDMAYDVDYTSETQLNANADPDSNFYSLGSTFGDVSSSSGFNQTEESSPYIVNTIYPLTQKRRMRSNELHYIDHPKLSLLLIITPYSGTSNDDTEEGTNSIN